MICGEKLQQFKCKLSFFYADKGPVLTECLKNCVHFYIQNLTLPMPCKIDSFIMYMGGARTRAPTGSTQHHKVLCFTYTM